MSTVTVNPTNLTSTYDLKTSYNPIIFGSATDITTGVYGAANGSATDPTSWTNWQVTNAGTIVAGATGAGITEAAVAIMRGTLTNSGTIENNETTGASASAVQMDTGSVVNTGVITAATDSGVAIGFSGTVTNSVNATGGGGTISGGVLGVDLGFYPGHSIPGGGSVTNNAKATISGDDGVLAAGANSAAVTNAGTITGTTAFTSGAYTFGFGVALMAGGTVTNTGTITGAADGVYIKGSATVNNNAGTITGAANGVDIAGAGTVTNAGTIESSAATGVKNGVVMFSGSVVNTGVIKTARASGVAIGSSGTVTNSVNKTGGGGTISGGVLGVDLGFNPGYSPLPGGGVVTNNAGATISGDDGVLAAGANSAAVTNAGTIKGTTVAAFEGGPNDNIPFTVGFGVALMAGGTVTNKATGTITGAADGVYLMGGGTVTNAAGGSIKGDETAVLAINDGATVKNSGMIGGSTTWVGVNLGLNTTNPGATTGGGVLDNYAGATISGYSGVVTGGATATVTNSGAIKGTKLDSLTSSEGVTYSFGDGVTMAAGGTITNNAKATISGVADGVWTLDADATVKNFGAISGTYSGVDLGINPLDPTATTGGGALYNYAGATISGDSGVVTGGATATVTNSGAIKGTKLASLPIDGVTYAFGDGVTMAAGGTITNKAKATISGVADGVWTLGAAATVKNSGAISGTLGGVDLGINPLDPTATTGGGALYNYAGATISGDSGVVTGGATATVTNSGAIKGTTSASMLIGEVTYTFGDGVAMAAGGSVTNQKTGTISGVKHGVFINGGGGANQVTNSGVITATGSGGEGINLAAYGTVTNNAGGKVNGVASGVYLSDGGTVTNNAGGTVTATGSSGTGIYLYNGGAVTNSGTVTATGSSGTGIYLYNGGVVTNSGKITATGSSGTGIIGYNGVSVTNSGTISGKKASVEFLDAGANTLTLKTGSTLTGAAIGSTNADATNALILEGTGTAGNLFDDFDTLTVDAGAAWTLSAASSIVQSTVDGGLLTVAGALTTAFDITDNGVVTLDVASSDKVTFGGNSGALVFGAAVKAASGFGGTVSGFGAGDAIIFDSLTYAAADTVSVNDDVVTVDNGAGTAVATFKINAPASFTLGKTTGGDLEVGVAANVDVVGYSAALDSDPNGFTITDTATNLESLTATGVATGPVILYANDGVDVSFSPAQTAAFAADGFMAAVADTTTDATTTNDLHLLSNNLTVSSSSAGLNVAGAKGSTGITQPTLLSNEMIAAAGLSGETFNFASGFGTSEITGFLVTGTTGAAATTADTLDLDTKMFKGMASTGSTTAAANAADLASLIKSDLSFSGGSAIVTDTAGDKLTLTEISTLAAFEKDIKFFTK